MNEKKKIILFSRPVDHYLSGTGIFATVYWLQKILNESKKIDLTISQKILNVQASKSVLSIIVYDLLNPIYIASVNIFRPVDCIFYADVSYAITIPLVKLLKPKAKFVTIIQDFHYRENTKFFMKYIRFLSLISFKYCDYILCTAEENKEKIIHDFKWLNEKEKRKIRVLNLGLTTISSNNNDLDNNLFEKRNFTFGYIGAGGKNKRIDKMFDCVKQLKKNGLMFSLVTAGKVGEIYSESFNQLEDNQFTYTDLGRITENDKRTFYKQIDAFLFTTESEGYGLPIIESAYYSKPTIVFKSALIPEFLKSKCLLLEDDYSNIVNLIDYISEDGTEYKKLIEKNQEFVKSLDWSNYVKFLEEI